MEKLFCAASSTDGENGRGDDNAVGSGNSCEEVGRDGDDFETPTANLKNGLVFARQRFEGQQGLAHLCPAPLDAAGQMASRLVDVATACVGNAVTSMADVSANMATAWPPIADGDDGMRRKLLNGSCSTAQGLELRAHAVDSAADPATDTAAAPAAAVGVDAAAHASAEAAAAASPVLDPLAAAAAAAPAAAAPVAPAPATPVAAAAAADPSPAAPVAAAAPVSDPPVAAAAGTWPASCAGCTEWQRILRQVLMESDELRGRFCKLEAEVEELQSRIRAVEDRESRRGGGGVLQSEVADEGRKSHEEEPRKGGGVASRGAGLRDETTARRERGVEGDGCERRVDGGTSGMVREASFREAEVAKLLASGAVGRAEGDGNEAEEADADAGEAECASCRQEMLGGEAGNAGGGAEKAGFLEEAGTGINNRELSSRFGPIASKENDRKDGLKGRACRKRQIHEVMSGSTGEHSALGDRGGREMGKSPEVMALGGRVPDTPAGTEGAMESGDLAPGLDPRGPALIAVKQEIVSWEGIINLGERVLRNEGVMFQGSASSGEQHLAWLQSHAFEECLDSAHIAPQEFEQVDEKVPMLQVAGGIQKAEVDEGNNLRRSSRTRAQKGALGAMAVFEQLQHGSGLGLNMSDSDSSGHNFCLKRKKQRKRDKLKRKKVPWGTGLSNPLEKFPTPFCTCTGVQRQVYRNGCWGWQSSCCTTDMSQFPLPPHPKRKGNRIPGRRMSTSTFVKLIHNLKSQGVDVYNPIDLKPFWVKHGAKT